MPIARKELVNLDTTPYYHCVARCVRRAFLCGKDAVTGKNYQHRKQWIVERLAQLSQIFAIDICAYAVMSDHYHIVLHIDQQRVKQWDPQDIAQKWGQLFSLPHDVSRFLNKEELSVSQQDKVNHWINQCKNRLCDLSWFMRALNESLARQANEEDDCSGRFWEGRFKSQALLDQSALLACMMHVDLSPERVNQQEKSCLTAMQQRLFAFSEQKRGRPSTKNSASLQPELVSFQDETPLHPDSSTSTPPQIAFSFEDYKALHQWTQQALAQKIVTPVSVTLAKLFEKLKFSPSHWLLHIKNFSKRFPCVAGSLDRLKQFCQKVGQRWVHGISSARKIVTC